MIYLLGRRGEPAAAEGDLEGADVVAVAGADVEQLENASTHKHLDGRFKKTVTIRLRNVGEGGIILKDLQLSKIGIIFSSPVPGPA